MITSALYSEAAENELVVVGEYRQSGRKIKMHTDAAGALQNLMIQARAAGIMIIPISGFRAVEYQASLFQKAILKHGSEEAAARWVARPGSSEHHTGLAIDLGDEKNPDCDVEQSFEATSSFRWLEINASRFGFELSFPRNNQRGINYEPWHWRFIGTPETKQIFQT